MWALALAAMVEATAGDRQPQTPLCQEVRVALKGGSKKRDITKLIKGATEITVEDVDCLNRGRFPGYVGRKAQAHLVRVGGLDALPSGPVDVWAVVPDPCAIVATQAPVIGWFGQAACMMDVTGTFSQWVVAQIESQALAALAEQGVEGEVAFKTVQIPAMMGVSWVGSAQRAIPVTAGTYHVLHIHIPDAVAAARAAKGDFMVGIGARMGMDIAGMVRDTVRQQVLSTLAAKNIASALIDLETDSGGP